MSVAALPIFRPRSIKLGASISDGDEADQTVQKTKWHQASDTTARSENFAADVVATVREIKNLIDR
jgi:hypothetical protein